MKLKKKLLLLLFCICMINMTACGSGKAATPFPGTPAEDMIVLDITSEPAGLTPLLYSDTMGETTLRHTLAGLTKLDKDDKPVPDMAESWETNGDDTVYTIHLRKDAKWSNGDPVTAGDFYFAWVEQMKPSTGSIVAKELYGYIKNGEAFYNGTATEEELGLKVLDDYTLQVQWENPMVTAPFRFALPAYYPVNRKVYEQLGAEQYGKSVDTTVTNGAYRITEWVHDDHILMERYEDYWNAASVNIAKAKLVMIGDENTRLNAFKAGEIDMGNLYDEQIDQVKNLSESAVRTYVDGGSWFFDFNLKAEFTSNENLRKALSYAIDVQSLLDNVIKDGSVAADGLVPQGIAGVETEYAAARGNLFGYDKEKAKEYLTKALEELGIQATDLKLKLLAHDSSYSQTQAVYLQQQWKENLGIDVELDIVPYQVRVEAQNNGNYYMLVRGWAPSENDAMSFLEIYETGNANNTGGFSNSEYDRLLKEAAVEADGKVRENKMIQAEKILIDQGVIGPLYFTRTTYALSEKVEGLTRSPFQLFNIYDGAKIVTKK